MVNKWHISSMNSIPDSYVSLKIYVISGREVAKLFDEQRNAGFFTVQFDGSKLSSGIYFYSMTVKSNGSVNVISKKMNLIK